MYNIKEVLKSKKLLDVVSRQIFEAVDADGSGQVSEDELHTIMCSLAEDFGYERPTVTETLKILEIVDIDRSGFVDFEEFSSLLKKVLKALKDDIDGIKKKTVIDEDEIVD